MDTYAGCAKACRTSEAPSWGSAVLSIVSYFVREVVCSPVRFARVLGRISINLSMQCRAFQLLRVGIFARFVCSNPRFLFKHLPPKYLIRDLAPSARTTCFLYHYRRLRSLLSDRLLRRLLQEDAGVFQMQQDGHEFAIAMGRSRQIDHTRHVDHEGELSLKLLVDGVQIYVLSFTIVPGWIVELPAAEVLMITRIQGELGVFDKISLASKSMHGIPPEMLLMAALQGVGEGFGIRVMAGVSAIRHLCYEVEEDAIFKKAYDELFERIGATRTPADFYVATFPLPEKPLAQVKRGQKSRARARRAFKMQVAMEIFDFLHYHESTVADRFSYADEQECANGATAHEPSCLVIYPQSAPAPTTKLEKAGTCAVAQ